MSDFTADLCEGRQLHTSKIYMNPAGEFPLLVEIPHDFPEKSGSLAKEVISCL